MKKLLLTVFTTLTVAGSAWASSNGIALDKSPSNTTDMASLQNGAKIFVNYCLSCHSAAFMRYNRLKDIGLTEQQIKDKLLFTTDKVGETMKSNINPLQAKEWFGANPPDLTLIARSRAGSGGTGADYLYTLLRSYYRDDTKATGWNNLVFPSIGMPHPLWELQGEREPVYEVKKVIHDGKETQEHIFKGWKETQAGTLSAKQYDEAVRDLVAYLQWMGEPAQNTRVRIGVWVALFLVLLSVITWRLNAAFWKDVK